MAMIVQRWVVERLLAKGLAEKRFSGRNIVLITDHSSKDNAYLTQALMDTGFRVKRHFFLPAQSGDQELRGRVISSVVDYVRGSDIEEIVVGAGVGPWSELRTLAADLRVLPFPVSFVPVGAASEMFRRPRRELGEAVCIELQRGQRSV